MNRRDFLKGSLGVGFGAMGLVNLSPALSALAGGNAGVSPRPNVLLIAVDDLGYGDLSSYGAEDLRTPHIDGLISEGMRFDNFYSNSPVCSPTRASLLTGRYPDMAGVPGVIRTDSDDSFGYLDEGAVMLPAVLKRAGYHTAMVGKWHLGLESPNLPNERGFDHFYGFLGDMMDDYYTHRRGGFNYMRLNDKEIDPRGHATDIFSGAAIDYLKTRTDSDEPFFLYLAYNAPHTPIQPPKEWVEKVKKRCNGISEKRAALAAMIEHLDDSIGKVIRSMKELKLHDNTLVIFVSDNGGQIDVGADNGNLNGGKCTMFEGGIRVPMCAVWPGRIKARTRSALVGMTMDIFPTICQAANVEFEGAIDGESFMPALLGRKQKNDRFLVWVRREGGDSGGRAHYAIRKGDYKLLHNSPFEPMKLYNLKDDPLEQNNLPRNHKMYTILFKQLQRHITKAGAVAWSR